MLLGSLGLSTCMSLADDMPAETTVQAVPTSDLPVPTQEVGPPETPAQGEACDPSSGDCEQCKPKKPPFFKTMKQKWHQFDKEQFHPDHCWPEQYAREAQRRVYAPLRQQLINGQTLESMIWLHYFDEKEPTKLNAAGESRLEYLASRRSNFSSTVCVQTSFDDTLDQQRMNVIQEYLARISRHQVAWNVVLTNRGKPWGLFGLEGPKTIDNMIGLAGQPPRYQPQMKQAFLNESDD